MKTTIGDIQDYIKGNRIGSREAELENSTGWKAVRKVHRSKRSYNRKDNKKSGHNPDFFCPGAAQQARLDPQCFLAIAGKHFTGGLQGCHLPVPLFRIIINSSIM